MRKNALEQYTEIPDPFMREVARLAVDRRISQGKLAELYNAAAGTGLKSKNTRDHFVSNGRSEKRVTPKVRSAYARALKMSPRYVELLTKGLSVEWRLSDLWKEKRGLLFPPEPVFEYLRPEIVEPLFEDGAIIEAAQALRNNHELLFECLYNAELAHQRALAMPESKYVPTLPIEEDVLSASDTNREYVTKWAAIAKVLLERRGIDLVSRIKRKSPDRIRQEEILSRVFGAVAPAHLSWSEWAAVENVLKAFFYKKKVIDREGRQLVRLPVDKMVERLHRHPAWDDFKLSDPDAVAQIYDESESHKGYV